MSFLGLDFGTTKFALSVISDDGETLFTAKNATDAYLQSQPNHSEQDVNKIITIATQTIKQIPEVLKKSISAIGLTGQMHGITIIQESSLPTPLVTWQDKRGESDNFSSYLFSRLGNNKLFPGYGAYTLSWYNKYHPDILRNAKGFSTIHDYFAYLICGEKEFITDSSNAASIGLFDPLEGKWLKDSLQALGLSCDIFPTIKPMGSMQGSLTSSWANILGLNHSLPIFVACGDNQASLFATFEDPDHEIAITIGTGSQISVCIPDRSFPESKFEYRPYFNNSSVAVGPALSGGNSFNWLVNTVVSWVYSVTGIKPNRDDVFLLLDRLGSSKKNSSVTMHPNFLGERYDMSLSGSILNLRGDHLDLGELVLALGIGLATTLKDFLPQELISNKKRIVGSGNGIRKLNVMQEALKSVFKLPLTLSQEREEAASGAALIARNGVKS